MAYSEKVIEHYENPRNVGSFEKGDDHVGTGMVGAPACGDVMKLQIRVNDQGIIEDAKSLADLPTHLAALSGHGERLLEQRLIPRILVPIHERIARG